MLLCLSACVKGCQECVCVGVCVHAFGLRAPAAVVVLILSWSAGVSPELEALLGFETA